MKIDINSDMGEGFGVYQVCDDEALMQVVSSANIACGFHAGDPAIMTRMVRLAKAHQVEIGAHPGLPDIQGFGRREMSFSHDELCQLVVYQVGALTAIARAEGMSVSHVSFHAALGNIINRDEVLASKIMSALVRLDPQIIVFCQSDTIIERAALSAGLPALTLFLADRAYDEQGKLVSRAIAGSVINSAEQVRARVRQFLCEGTVTTFNGHTLAIRAHSILVHSDTPGALELAALIRQEALANGVSIAPAKALLHP
jgi:UPF0271 protein